MILLGMVRPALKACLLLSFLFLFWRLFRLREELHLAGLREGVRYLWRKKGRLIAPALCFFLAGFGSRMILEYWSPDMLMVFSYEEAAKGQNPNATRFNEAEILSASVLEKVIRRGALEMTPEQLARCLAISTPLDEEELSVSTPSDLKVSTERWVSCSPEISLYHADPRTVLNLLADVYWEEFIKNYGENDRLLDLDLDVLDELEYLDKKDYLRMQANRLRNYLPAYSSESASFRTVGEEETFSSLSGKIGNFIDIELERYEAFLLENGLATDRQAYRSRLEYVNRNLQVIRDKDMAAHDIRIDAVNLYNAFMSRFVLIPTYDADREFYMSRTKVGVDYFADEAKEYLAGATSVVETMDHNNYISAQMESSAASPAIYAQADRQIQALKTELLGLAAQCRALCDEYVKEKRNGYIRIGFSSPSVTGAAAGSLLLTGLFAAAESGILLLEPLRRRSRRQAARATAEQWILHARAGLPAEKEGGDERA